MSDEEPVMEGKVWPAPDKQLWPRGEADCHREQDETVSGVCVGGGVGGC